MKRLNVSDVFFDFYNPSFMYLLCILTSLRPLENARLCTKIGARGLATLRWRFRARGHLSSLPQRGVSLCNTHSGAQTLIFTAETLLSTNLYFPATTSISEENSN